MRRPDLMIWIGFSGALWSAIGAAAFPQAAHPLLYVFAGFVLLLAAGLSDVRVR